MRLRSFKTRLMLVVALAVTVPTLLAGVYLGDHLEREARDLTASQLRASLETVAVLLQGSRDQLGKGLARLLENEALRGRLERKDTAQISVLVEEQRQALDLAWLGVYAADSRPIAASGSDTDQALASLAFSEQGARAEACGASHALAQLVTCAGRDYLLWVLPVYSNAAPSPSAGERAGEGASQVEAWLVGGTPLVGPELVASLRSHGVERPLLWVDDRAAWPEQPPAEVARPLGVGEASRRLRLDGAAWLAASRTERVGARRLGLGVLLPLGPLEARLRSALLTVAALGLVLLGVTLAALQVVTSRISRPIRQLREGAARLAAGDLDYRIQVGTGDELEALADQFNLMAGRLQASRADLERKVEERTREVAEKSRQLEVASRHKSEFLANMSHELRTPMNAIIGYSEMLQEDARAQHHEAMVPDLEKIHGAARHLLGLINGILDLSKIEAGKMDLYLEDVEVARLVAEVESTIGPVVARGGNRLEVRIEGELGVAHTDVTKLRQCLFNLLGNAAKFTSGDVVALEVAREAGPDGDALRLSVRDRGIGMTPEQVARLFQPFTQADASTTRRFGGTGLGLAITRAFVEMLGGTIQVESQVGRGSTFTVRVPAHAAGAGARDPLPAAAAPAATGQATAPDDGQAPAVLVIDDDPDVRAIMERLLLRDGYRPVLATGGVAGLELARRVRPAAITLDVLMPDMDGWCVLSALKADPALAATPVIMLTIADDRRRAYSLGASNFITKPLDHARMSALLRQYVPAGPSGVIQVVDDDPLVRRMAREMLERSGWEVNEAVDGRTALAQDLEVRPQLVLLDLMMPGMDGFEFIRQFRANQAWRDIPVIVVTSKDLTAEDRQRLSGYVTRVLAKGAEPLSEVLARLRVDISACVPRGAAAPPPAAEGRLDA